MSRFIVLVLDGFGVGAMEDAADYKKEDIGTNTALHVLESNPQLYLPNLSKIGLINILGKEINGMKFSPDATYGKSKLKHFGADTYYGHQEIVGTDPKRTETKSLAKNFEKIKIALEKEGHKVKEYKLPAGGKVMGIDDIMMVCDNDANDPGQVYNAIGVLDKISFKEVVEICKIIRNQVEITRVIAHACEQITYEDLENVIFEPLEGYGGLDFIDLDIYQKNIQILHLGYGVDVTGQVPYILGKENIPVTHLGKFADLVSNEHGKSISCVNTEKLLELLINSIDEQEEGLIAANVQETDLSGHEQNLEKYYRILRLVDDGLGKILPKLKEDDIMVIMADHGNDPTSGSILHSREHVPLMIIGKNLNKGDIGIRETMSDVGATILDYFKNDPKFKNTNLKDKKTQNGESFLHKLM